MVGGHGGRVVDALESGGMESLNKQQGATFIRLFFLLDSALFIRDVA